MFCNKCNSKVSENDKFCGKCGNMLFKNENNNQISNNINVSSVDNQINSNMQYTNNVVNNNGSVVKKKKNNIVIVVIVLVVIALGIVFAGMYVLKLFSIIDGNKNDFNQGSLNSNVNSNIEKLELEQMSFEYDKSIWTTKVPKKTISEGSFVGAKNENSYVAMSFATDKVYYDSYNLASRMKDSYEQRGCIILEDLEMVSIDGLRWYKIVYQDEKNYVYLQLFYSSGYDTFSFTYSNISLTSYYLELSEIKKVYNTLKYTPKEEVAQSVDKTKVIGEWNWGAFGYAVIDENKVYLYKDSSKDSNNLIIGSYTLTDKVATIANGYVDGINIIINVESAYLEGEKKDIKKLQYALIPNNDGTYALTNLGTGGRETAIKIK